MPARLRSASIRRRSRRPPRPEGCSECRRDRESTTASRHWGTVPPPPRARANSRFRRPRFRQVCAYLNQFRAVASRRTWRRNVVFPARRIAMTAVAFPGNRTRTVHAPRGVRRWGRVHELGKLLAEYLTKPGWWCFQPNSPSDEENMAFISPSDKEKCSSRAVGSRYCAQASFTASWRRSRAARANSHMLASRSPCPVSRVRTRAAGPATARQVCPAASP